MCQGGANTSSKSKEHQDMQPWRPQNGAMSSSLYKASSKSERCSETASQREHTLVGNKGSKSKAHQEHNFFRHSLTAAKWGTIPLNGFFSCLPYILHNRSS